MLLASGVSAVQQYAVRGPGLLHQAVSRGLLSVAALFLDKGCDATECIADKDNDQERATSALLLLIEATQVWTKSLSQLTAPVRTEIAGRSPQSIPEACMRPFWLM